MRRLLWSDDSGPFISAGTLGPYDYDESPVAIIPPKALELSAISRRQVGVRDGLQGPLRNGNGNKAGLSEAMLDCCLERVGAAQLGVCDDQANGPVNGDSQCDEEDDTCKQTGLAKSVGLTNDAGTTAEAGQIKFMRIELGLGEGDSRSLNACQKGSALPGIVPPFAPVVCGQIVLLFDQILVVLMVVVKTTADRVFDVEVDTDGLQYRCRARRPVGTRRRIAADYVHVHIPRLLGRRGRSLLLYSGAR
ncbi:hypothetical protein KCV06_g427, partial [Aureobasidium melanogenum]